MPNNVTYAQLQRTVRDHVRFSDETQADRVITRAIEAGLERVSGARLWSFQRKLFFIATIPPRSEGTVVASGGSSTITGAGIVPDWDDAMIGRFIEINGEMDWYRIAAVPDVTELTIEFPYVGPVFVPPAYPYQIIAAEYPLPANFFRLRQVQSVQLLRPLREVPPDEMRRLQLNFAGTGQPHTFSVETLPEGGKALQLYPPPSDVSKLILDYDARIGWFAANGTWKQFPTVGSDTVDWPDEQISLLRKACELEAYREIGDGARLEMAEGDYALAEARATANDEEGPADYTFPRQPPFVSTRSARVGNPPYWVNP